MIATLGVLSVGCAALAWAAAAALAMRWQRALLVMTMLILAVWVSTAPTLIADLPATLLDDLASEARSVELFALLLAMEAFIGMALVWSRHPVVRATLMVPLPSVLGLPMLAAHVVMVHGPRLDLTLLGGLGLGAAGLGLFVTFGIATWLRRIDPDLLIEAVMLARLLPVAGAVTAVAALHHRPAPTLAFEPLAFLVVTALCGSVTLFGFFRRRAEG